MCHNEATLVLWPLCTSKTFLSSVILCSFLGLGTVQKTILERGGNFRQRNLGAPL